LVYELPKDKTATELTLKVAPNTATTPVATLELCALVTPTLNIEQGGPMSDGPDFDCEKHANATLDAGGDTFKFSVDELLTESTLAVAILPGDSTLRVVLDKPDESSLATGPSLDPSDDSFTEGAPTVPEDTSTSTGSTDTGTASVPQPAPNVGAPQLTGGSAPQDDPPVVAPEPTDAAPSVAATPVAAVAEAEGGTKPLAVGLLLAGLAIGAVLWALAGSRPLDGPPEA
jgi:hypothetical protein